MDKSAGVPQNMAYDGQLGNPTALENCNQPLHGPGAPPAYTEAGYPQAGQAPPGQGYGYPGQAYGYPAQGHPQPGQGYPQSGQGYPQPGQGYSQPPHGYSQPPQGYGYPQQQQYGHTNVVVSQPFIQSQPITGPLPPDHMCAAIFVTLCCFWPTGVVAIMRASDARNALARGDVASAHAHASSAKSMVTISVIVGIISFVVIAIIIGVYVGIVLKNINDFD